MPPALNGQWDFSPVLTEILRGRRAWQRASDFSCLCKKSNQKNTPLGVKTLSGTALGREASPEGRNTWKYSAALRASRERSAYGKAAPTRHPCRDGTKQAFHGLFTMPTALRSRRPQNGDIKPKPKSKAEIKNPNLSPWRMSPLNLRFVNTLKTSR